MFGTQAKRAGIARIVVVPLLVLGFWAGVAPAMARAQVERAADLESRDGWSAAAFADQAPQLPFSFTLAGRPSSELLAAWPHTRDSQALDPSRTQQTDTWTDRSTGLKVECLRVGYADFPALEWTVRLTNTGGTDTPLLESIEGLHAAFPVPTPGDPVLHYWNGDTCAPDLYQPFEQALAVGQTKQFAPVGGRGSNGAFPYYNLQVSGGGMLLAVGWPGQWATRFTRTSERELEIVSGQEGTHLVLRPGETVRTPLIALLFWKGSDPVLAQNLWRRWMWAHNVPRTADGALPPPLLFGNTSGEFNEMCNADEANQVAFLDRYQQERIPIDFWWMDAGWYPCDGNWPKTGTWEPDLKRFPHGLRAISDHASSHRVRTLVWFEPERVAPGTFLSDNHADWLLGGTILNLGNPAARDWLTNHVDMVLREQLIALYRQDFNIDPLDFWHKADAPDRQGMTENLHVQGYLAYWDALRKKHPQLIIDSCASGGRRNDLETMRRAIALHPTDYNYGDLTTKQAFHHSLWSWLPSFGSNTVPVDSVDAYAIRSGHARHVVLGYDFRRSDLDYEKLRALVSEWRQIVPAYAGDYYPLTPYNRDDSQWLAWQFHRQDTGSGIVEAFRRPKCEGGSVAVALHALDPSVLYQLTDLNTGAKCEASGSSLSTQGLVIAIGNQPGATVLMYEKMGSECAP